MWQSVDIWTFSIPNFETSFMENENFFSKNWSTAFQLKALTLKTRHFHTKLPYQKNIITQIEWWVQTGPITKNGVLPVATLFLWKFCFLLTTSYKELIDVLTNQMPIFMLFVSDGVLLDGAFSLWVSLSFLNLQHLECTEKNTVTNGKLVTLYVRSTSHVNAVLTRNENIVLIAEKVCLPSFYPVDEKINKATFV